MHWAWPTHQGGKLGFGELLGSRFGLGEVLLYWADVSRFSEKECNEWAIRCCHSNGFCQEHEHLYFLRILPETWEHYVFSHKQTCPFRWKRLDSELVKILEKSKVNDKSIPKFITPYVAPEILVNFNVCGNKPTRPVMFVVTTMNTVKPGNCEKKWKIESMIWKTKNEVKRDIL